MEPTISTPTTPTTKSPKIRRLPFLLVSGILLLTVVLSLIYGHSSNKTTTSVKATQAEVAINSDSFTPKTIYVKAGTQLTWTNNDTKPHQVAADPYPKNNSIPGFNNDLPLSSGDSYSFTFNKKGKYTYHDQLAPFNLQGTVVVE
jgi:plastocyanin